MKHARKRKSDAREGPERHHSRVGKVTREAILAAAVQVVTERGYARFSLPSVARQVGISHGNLNYYFPTRRVLLEALIDHLLVEYRDRLSMLRSPAKSLGAASLGEFIDWLLDDAISSKTNRLFRELWAMANHYDFVARALNRIQDDAVRELVAIFGASAKGAEATKLRTAACLLVVVADGTATNFGTRKRSGPQFRRVRQAAKDLLAPLFDGACGGRGFS
jgi:AcrR family transcriptional regulator